MALFRNFINKFNLITRNISPAQILNNNFNLLPRCVSSIPTPFEIVDNKEVEKETKEIVQNVNDVITNNKAGRLFAVVHLAGKQFKITEGDVVIIEGYWPPTVGDKISLDKVLLVGSQQFSLIGRPLVQHGLVNVLATVIEKTMSHTKTHFRKKRRKQYKKIHFYRMEQTMLRINTISINGEVNKPPDVTGLNYAVF